MARGRVARAISRGGRLPRIILLSLEICLRAWNVRRSGRPPALLNAFYMPSFYVEEANLCSLMSSSQISARRIQLAQLIIHDILFGSTKKYCSERPDNTANHKWGGLSVHTSG